MPVRGETQPLTVTFYDVPGGAVTDPTDVSLSILLDDAVVYGPLGVPPVVKDATGRYRYEWAIPLDADLGTYTVAWTGILPGSETPSVGYETVEVTSGLAPDPTLPDFCWPVDTSCVAGWDDYSSAVQNRAVALAAQSLRVLTAFRVGGCPVTIRPCRQRCTPTTWRTYPAVWGGYGSSPWFPVYAGGNWLNIACGLHLGGCGCTTIHQLDLPLPVGSIEEVKVDGAVLDPSAYRLDSGGRLLRIDGEGWPLCQDMEAADTEVGTWSITYTQGIPVDGLGAYACGVLAGEFAKACGGGKCRLPAGVQTVARGGVTMTLTPGVFPDGRTGIHEVDAWLDRYNPHRLRSAPTVWSPDQVQQRRLR